MSFDPAAERLIDAAFDVIVQSGEEGFTAEAVVAAGDVGLDELENYFGGFEGLTAAVYDRCLGVLSDELVAALDRVRTAEHGVQAIIVTYLRFTEQAPEVARFIHYAGRLTEEVHARKALRMRAILGWFRPHMDSGAMARVPEPLAEALLMGAAAETARQWLTEAPGVDLDVAIPVLAARVWQSLCPQQTLTFVARKDRESGLRLILPEHWKPVQDEPLEPFTLAVAGRQAEEEDEYSPVGRDRAEVEERRLWQEAMEGDFGVDEGSGGAPAEGPPAIYVGRWDNLIEEQPGERELVEGAALLASTYGEYFGVLPANPGHSMDYSRRAMTIDGRPAATASYHLSGRHGESYLRAVVVHRGEDGVSFVLGRATSGADRAIIDKVLGEVALLRQT